MKKLLVLTICSVLLFTLTAKAGEEYEAYNYKNGMDFSINRFVQDYNRLNQSLSDSNYHNGRNYTKFEDVWNYGIKTNMQYKNISGGIYVENGYNFGLKYYKLRNTCQKYSKSIDKTGACAKLILDINGFGNGEDKLMSNTSTMRAKDQYELYLYSDKVKPAIGSVEESILFLRQF